MAANAGNQAVTANGGKQTVTPNAGNQAVTANAGKQTVTANAGKQTVTPNAGKQTVTPNAGKQTVTANANASGQTLTNQAASGQALIEVRDLKEYFPVLVGMFRTKPLKAVDGVSFSIRKGETLGLVGESGCGKTTVGRTLLHLYKPTGGEILYNGKPIQSKADITEFRKKATMVFQDPYSSLNPRMTVSDIIGEPLDIHKMYANAAERQERILELMNRVGLNSEHAARYAHEFSGGQRQRIGIARALALKPDFIVCDEPVSALDVSIQAQVINMFDELQEQMGLTYLFIAHDILVVRHISDRIAVMYLGRMVELADAEEIYERPLHPYTKSLMSAVPQPDPKTARANRRIALTGDIPSPLNAPSGCPFRTRCPHATEACAAEMPPFNEVSPGHFAACHRIAELN